MNSNSNLSGNEMVNKNIPATVKTPISEDQFNYICNQIETTDKGIVSICKVINISQDSFYKFMEITGELSKERYARAKENQIEIILDSIIDLNDKCLEEIRTIDDPKRCNAIQSAYREQIRHKEWIASKLKAKKYGDKLTLDGDLDLKIQRAIALPGKLQVNENVYRNE
jgi:hypothetical protein